MSISIIIPVYNEEEVIELCLEETHKAFRTTDYEIIIVNDGSTDRSHGIICRLVNGNRHVRYISYPANKGYSYAIRQGIQMASKEYSSYLDADLQYHPSQLREMYDFAREEKLVFLLGKPTRKYYKVYRRMLSYVYNLLVSRLLDLKVTDANSVKLIKTDILKTLKLRGELGAIELEVLVGVANRSIPIKLFPIDVQERVGGRSKSGLKLILPTIKSILELRAQRSHSSCGR